MTQVDDFNPFEAPKSQSPDSDMLADDAEFLFSSREILCREQVELPKACIRLGDVENLVQRKKTLRIISGVGVAGVILFVVCIMIIPPIYGWAGALTVFAAAVIVSVIHRFTLRFAFPAALTVDATWYVSERYLNRVKWQDRFGRALILVIASLLAWLITRSLDTWAEQAGAFLLVLGIGFVVGFGLRTEVGLALRGRRLTGRHRGLMVLTGHSRRFANTAERINAGY